MATRQTNFESNFAWQKKYMPAVFNIVGPRLLMEAPLEIDMKECTDLMVLIAKDMRIGCRIRREGFLGFGDEFTIRSKVPSGAKTELAKITEGWGDWLFYAHAEHDDLPSLAKWMIVDLHAWRAHMIRSRSAIKKGERLNNDGTHFVWFDVTSFPDNPPICVDRG